MRKRFLAGMLCVSMVVCSINFAGSAFAKSGAKLNKKNITLEKGKSYKLKVKKYTGKVKWKSSKKKIAKVSKKGIVKAVKPGKAVITAYGKKLKLKCKVKVIAAKVNVDVSIYTKVPAVNSALPSTNAPVKTDVPVKTDAPVKTEAPVKTDEPTQTEAPVKTQAPTQTEAPVKTQAPTQTEVPVKTQAPTPTKAPVKTQAPTQTEAPVKTQAPTQTEVPVKTQAPTPTKAPVKTQAPTPTKAPGGVAASDFTDKSIVTAEGDDVVINVSGDSVCNITLPAFKALIVKNPDTSKNCKYMQIECTSDLVDVYLFDNRFTDGTGQTAAGQHLMGQMSSPTYKTFLFEINGEFSGNYITAAKFVNIDWGGNSKSMKIKSIKFLKDKPQTEDANIADMATIMNPPSDYDKKKDNVEYGSFTNISYYSDITKSNRTANVVLPPNYDTSKKYPVVYMMHGIGCAKEMFGTSIDNSSIAKIYGNLRAEGKAVDMIIVFPGIRVSDEPEKDTHSNENYKHYDDFREDLINNLMPAMSKKFSVKTGRENTAICGWSMGGREALYIGLSKPEYFGYIAGYCPAFGLLPYTNADVGKSEDGLLTIPGATEDILKISDKYVNNTFIQIGHGIYDSVVRDEPTRYSKALTNGGVPHIYTEYPSGHSDGVYNPGFYNLALNAFKLVK